MWSLLIRLVVAATFGIGAYVTLPQAWQGLELRLAADDPARLTDLRLDETFNRDAAIREIEAALKAGDAELAQSFVALGAERGIQLPQELLTRVEIANSAVAEAQRSLYNFAHGFITGEPNDAAGLAGATTGDFMVFGDIRDLAREGSRWMQGDAADPLIAGLAAAGLAVTAGTYFSLGTAAPARIGSTLLKVARRTGRIGARLTDNVIGLLKARRTGRVASALADVGQIQRRAGTRAALEGLRHADDVADLARAGKLAEKKGRSTLAIFKTLGRGAIALGAGALAISGWVIGAAANLVFLVIAIVSTLAAVLRWLWPRRLTLRKGPVRVQRIYVMQNPARSGVAESILRG